jgi:hypothetical protein
MEPNKVSSVQLFKGSQLLYSKVAPQISETETVMQKSRYIDEDSVKTHSKKRESEPKFKLDAILKEREDTQIS